MPRKRMQMKSSKKNEIFLQLQNFISLFLIKDMWLGEIGICEKVGNISLTFVNIVIQLVT